ncbi:hypothetical protein RQP46_009631 [Phenoliferia psychrophenolica]
MEPAQSTLQPPPPAHLFPPASTTQPASAASEPVNDALARDFPQIAQMSREDMTALLEDDAYFDAFFNTMPEALPMHQAVEQRMRSNIAIAQKNEALRPNLEALRTETANLFGEVNELKARWSHLEAAQADTQKRFSPGAQLNRLRSATSGQEHLSESLVSSFLDGGMDEESFVKQYKDIRKVYHRRAVNLEKWEAGSVVGWGR